MTRYHWVHQDLVGGRGMPQPREFYDLLLRRLRIASSITTGALVALLGLYLWDLDFAAETRWRIPVLAPQLAQLEAAAT